MSGIPLHIQRHFEQRWVARFVSPASSTAPKRLDLKRPVHNLPLIAKAKEKPARLSQRGGYESANRLCTRGPSCRMRTIGSFRARTTPNG
jgi:hypothetical protein